MKNYSWSSLMIKFNPVIDEHIMSFANQHIPYDCQNDPEDGSGIVTDPHISLLTDLEITFPDSELRSIIRQIPTFTVDFGPISFFRNGKVDVIKIEIISEQLNAIHYNLRSLIPNHYSFDEYQPHSTLAFVKPGSCDSILNQANYFRGISYEVNWINYNSAKGISHSIKINQK